MKFIMQDEKLREAKYYYVMSAICFAVFVAFTLFLKVVDVMPIGQENSQVGFAYLNRLVQKNLPFSDFFRKVSDICIWLTVGIAAVFAFCGVVQWIKRKSIKKVDAGLLALGAVLLLTALFYLFFEVVIINYRPSFVPGKQASYPSSHTLLAVVVIGNGMTYLSGSLSNRKAIAATVVPMAVVLAFVVFGRLMSGLHWFTDIVGAVLLGIAINKLWAALTQTITKSRSAPNPPATQN